MARVAQPNVSTAGVYAHLRRFFEADLQEWQANACLSQRSGAPFPRQRILDDLRAGGTVNVPTYALPKSAMEGAPARLGPPDPYAPGGVMMIRPERAIVTPGDSITFSDDDAIRLWLQENEL